MLSSNGFAKSTSSIGHRHLLRAMVFKTFGVTFLILTPALVIILIYEIAYLNENSIYGPNYILWKAGVRPMDLDRVAQISIASGDYLSLLIGKTRTQVLDRFRVLTPVADASPGTRWQLAHSDYSNKQGVFLRHTPLFIVFEGDTARACILLK
jgi:hypothetical protein